MKRLILLIFVLSSMIMGCKSSQGASSGEEKTVGVYFVSKSRGPDSELIKKFESMIKEDYSSLDYSVSSYGREGEKKYCISSKGMKTKDFDQFMTDTKALFGDSDMVSVKENDECTKDK